MQVHHKWYSLRLVMAALSWHRRYVLTFRIFLVLVYTALSFLSIYVPYSSQYCLWVRLIPQ